VNAEEREWREGSEGEKSLWGAIRSDGGEDVLKTGEGNLLAFFKGLSKRGEGKAADVRGGDQKSGKNRLDGEGIEE